MNSPTDISRPVTPNGLPNHDPLQDIYQQCVTKLRSNNSKIDGQSLLIDIDFNAPTKQGRNAVTVDIFDTKTGSDQLQTAYFAANSTHLALKSTYPADDTEVRASYLNLPKNTNLTAQDLGQIASQQDSVSAFLLNCPPVFEIHNS